MSRLHDRDWSNDGIERGVTVVNFSLIAQEGRLSEPRVPIAVISMHALSPRIERGERRDHDALLADLARLVEGNAAEGLRTNVRCAPIADVQSNGSASRKRTFHRPSSWRDEQLFASVCEIVT